MMEQHFSQYDAPCGCCGARIRLDDSFDNPVAVPLYSKYWKTQIINKKTVVVDVYCDEICSLKKHEELRTSNENHS